MTALYAIERDVLTIFRQCTLCVALDRLGLTDALVGGLPGTATATEAKTIAAAEALNVVEHGDDGFRWAPQFHALARDGVAWRRFLHLILHQTTYIGLADSIEQRLTPVDQSADSTAYRRFLEGVAASHVEHARAFADLKLLDVAERLVDLGCGLGTFSQAWIASRATRTATCVDLPRAVPLTKDALGSERVAFVGADLNDECAVPSGDVYLLANVLHLLPRWRRSIEHIARCMSPDATLVIMEADPTPAAGKLFDFQVHLRSGTAAGLVPPMEIEETLNALGLTVERQTAMPDASDPFDRTYHWWFAHNRSDAHVEGRR